MQAPRKFACHITPFNSRMFSLSRPKHNLSQKIISYAEQKIPHWNFNLCHRQLAHRAPPPKELSPTGIL